MLKGIIVEDKKHHAETLQLMLKEADASIFIVASCISVDDAVSAINKFKPDIVFLDNELGKETGLDVLKNIVERNFEVIFTTGHNKYAIDAIKLSALDFLLKPFGTDELKSALAKAEYKIMQNQKNERMSVLVDNLALHDIQERKMALSFLNNKQTIEIYPQLKDIIYIESNDDSSAIYLTKTFAQTQKSFLSGIKSNTLIVSKSLKHFEEFLLHMGFFRIHKQHIINLQQVNRYADDGTVYLNETDEPLNVASTKRDSFKEARKQFLLKK